MESFHSHRALTAQAGFTLIELLVVLAIIAVVTGIVLTSQSSFNRTLVVANTAYDVALTLRSAETYGLGSRGVGALTNAGYGIDFEKATPSSFTLFLDKYPSAGAAFSCHPAADPSAPSAEPGDCVYEAAQGEKVSLYTLGNGITLSNFCAYAGGAWSCAADTLTSLAIVFARPNPVAFISANGSYSLTTPASAACLTLSSPAGGSRYVSVNSVGRITAGATSCP
ncbi:type II secretion system protein [Candidatus Kaiserbacteria bacterium]|nr:type II secretion system protein [Candidatus Kaiserbacteria bacterium]